MNRLVPAGLFAVAAFAPTVFGQTSSAAAATVITATQGIALSQLLSATDLGAVPASQPLTVRLGLNLRNKAALLSLIQEASDPTSELYGMSLTPKQFTAGFAPTSSQVQQVVSFLQKAGFTGVTVEPNNMIVSADGTAALAATAFKTSLESYSQFGRTVFGNKTAPQLPAALGPIVASVLGLNNIGQMKSPIASTTSAPQYLVSYNPKQFVHIYGGDGVNTATKTSIAIMAEGDVSSVVTDLRTEEKLYGLPQVPVQIKQVGLASTDTSGLDEWDMDTQYSTGLAGTVKKLYLYTTTSLSDSDLALEVSHWVTDDLAQAASASLGECELFPYIDGSMIVFDNAFLEAAAQGQTFFASSGDTGSFCPVGPLGVNGVPAGAPLVQYPAASPYVIGVGGTTLLTNTDGSYNSETAWYSGGGGLSQFESATYWQEAASTLISTAAERGVPDIAYDADPNSGANVVVSGTVEAVGGTSLSSPMALGTWARALSLNPKLGFAGIRLYSLYNGSGLTGTYPKGGFHDITVGVNGLYAAGPGYDLTTGLGTPWISQLVSDLSK